MKLLPIILASGSPRRRQLLEEAGFKFKIKLPHCDETIKVDESPYSAAMRLAFEKTKKIALESKSNSLILGADTIVVFNNQILGKPRSKNEAAKFLRRLSNQRHEVITGWCLMKSPDKIIKNDIEISYVTFRKITDKEIETCVQTGESMDKAGAYAIQGIAKKFVLRVDGSLNNIIGLPIEKIGPAIEEWAPKMKWKV